MLPSAMSSKTKTEVGERLDLRLFNKQSLRAFALRDYLAPYVLGCRGPVHEAAIAVVRCDLANSPRFPCCLGWAVRIERDHLHVQAAERWRPVWVLLHCLVWMFSEQFECRIFDPLPVPSGFVLPPPFILQLRWPDVLVHSILRQIPQAFQDPLE